jgi:Flp pilus assembly pilin Flp
MQDHLKLAKARTRKRGAVMVEYAFLLTFVAIPGGLGILASGVKLHQSYVETRANVLAPTP